MVVLFIYLRKILFISKLNIINADEYYAEIFLEINWLLRQRGLEYADCICQIVNLPLVKMVSLVWHLAPSGGEVPVLVISGVWSHLCLGYSLL